MIKSERHTPLGGQGRQHRRGQRRRTTPPPPPTTTTRCVEKTPANLFSLRVSSLCSLWLPLLDYCRLPSEHSQRRPRRGPETNDRTKGTTESTIYGSESISDSTSNEKKLHQIRPKPCQPPIATAMAAATCAVCRIFTMPRWATTITARATQ